MRPRWILAQLQAGTFSCEFQHFQELVVEPQTPVLPSPKLAEGGYRRDPQRIFSMDPLLQRNKAVDDSNLTKSILHISL